MKTFNKYLKLSTLLLFFLAISSCKKNDDNFSGDQSVIGDWSNVKITGISRHTSTNYTFRADGTGHELIWQSVGTSNTDISDDELVWSTEDNKILKFTVKGLPEEVYKYKIYNINGGLSMDLEDKSGNVITYLKER